MNDKTGKPSHECNAQNKEELYARAKGNFGATRGIRSKNKARVVEECVMRCAVSIIDEAVNEEAAMLIMMVNGWFDR